MNWRRASLLFLLAVTAGSLLHAGDDGPCGTPPDAKKKRIKGGESFPPLPLPATPLRRSERKRQPAPPVLIGKVVWGEQRTSTDEDGDIIRYSDWNLDPNDIPNLLKTANLRLGIKYRGEPVNLRQFHWDPAQMPILYVTGRRPFTLPDDLVPKLRDYVERGGFLWGDACHGSTSFAESFRSMMTKVFPDRPLVPIPPDHPLFHSAYPLESVSYSKWTSDRPDSRPYLEGVWIGCRTAVMLSPYDLSCAWDSSHVPEDSAAVMGDSALRLGLDMISYCLAYYDLGRYLSATRVLTSDDESVKGDFVFAQVRHAGIWDPDPSAFSNMLKSVIAETSTRVNFQRKVVALTDANLSQYPFLYITGHGDFALSTEEAAALRRFLDNGGFLLSDACCGNLGFDASFRREMAKVFPDTPLAELPPDHPLFTSHYEIRTVGYSPRVAANFREMNVPFLEGIAVGGSTRVVYSRFDLGCGWENEEHPYTLGVAGPDALRIGINAAVYALTH